LTDALVKTFEKENAAAAKQTWETAGVLLRADAKGVQRSAPVNISHRPIESTCGVMRGERTRDGFLTQLYMGAQRLSISMFNPWSTHLMQLPVAIIPLSRVWAAAQAG